LLLQSIRNWWWEVFCFAIYLALSANQLFMRPITGMADNGDFPKVLAPLDVCAPDRARDVLHYVYPTYVIDAGCHWDSRVTSSETLFVEILKQATLWNGRTSFSITGAGAAHLCVVLAGLIVLLRALHAASPVFRFGITPLAILIFSDVTYVSYLNSFYMDAASMVFLLLTAALAVAAVLRPRAWVAIAYGVAGALLALSKTQHAVTGFLFAGLAAWFALRGFRDGRRLTACWWAMSAVAISAAAALTVVMTPEDYKAEPLYNLIFYNLLPASKTPAPAIDELGLPYADLQYAGTYAYSPGSPVTTPAWREDFIREVSYGNLLRYYLHHPSVPLQLVGHSLQYFAPAMRPGNIANYRREDGFPPDTLAQRFDWWSHQRAWFMWVFPAQLAILFGLMGTGALVCTVRPVWAARWPLYPAVLALVASGTVEFLFSVLLDAAETARHLFLFHVVTELLIICAMAAVLSLVAGQACSQKSPLAGTSEDRP